MVVNPPETGTWIKPLGDVFLGLNDSAVIRRVIGVIDILPSINARQIQGLTWQEFVTQYAAESAQEGLNYAWMAMARGHVDARYWPPYLPFKPGIMARLRPVENDPIISFAVHLATDAQYDYLDAIIGKLLNDAMNRLVRMSHQVFRGVPGPLTDQQVKEIGTIVTAAERAQQILEDLRAAVFVPAVSAPLPRSLKEYLAFDEGNFMDRRAETQRITIHHNLSGEKAYCPPDTREMIERIISTLLGAVTPESVITLSDRLNDTAAAIEIVIRYHTAEIDLTVSDRIDPLALSSPDRFGPTRTIERLVTAAQARLTPVNGRAWAETCQDATGCIILSLPHWRSEPSAEKDA